MEGVTKVSDHYAIVCVDDHIDVNRTITNITN